MIFKATLITATVLACLAIAPAQANENFEVWAAAHEKLEAKWRHEPRCGWTVGGYTCKKRHEARRFQCPSCGW